MNDPFLQHEVQPDAYERRIKALEEQVANLTATLEHYSFPIATPEKLREWAERRLAYEKQIEEDSRRGFYIRP